MTEKLFRPEDLGLEPQKPLVRAERGNLRKGKESGRLAVYEIRDTEGRHVANQHIRTFPDKRGRREKITTHLVGADGKEVKAPRQVKELVYDQKQGGRIVEGKLLDEKENVVRTIELVGTPSEYIPCIPRAVFPSDVEGVYVIRNRGRNDVRIDSKYLGLLEVVDARPDVNRVYYRRTQHVAWPPKSLADLFDGPIVTDFDETQYNYFPVDRQFSPAYTRTHTLRTVSYGAGVWCDLPRRQEGTEAGPYSETKVVVTFKLTSGEELRGGPLPKYGARVTKETLRKRYERGDDGRIKDKPIEIVKEEEVRERVKGGTKVSIYTEKSEIGKDGKMIITEDTGRERTFDRKKREIRYFFADSLAKKRAITEIEYKGDRFRGCQVNDESTGTRFVFTARGEKDPSPPRETLKQWQDDFGWSFGFALCWKEEPKRYRLSSGK